MKQYFDCIIVGAGIAGVTAGVYLKRAGKKILILEKGPVGGTLVKTSIVENYPGFDTIDGVSFAMNLEKQIKFNDIELKYEEVINIKDFNNYKEVLTNKETYQTKNVIIATGRIPRTLGLINEQKLIGKGISYCALCDGTLYKNKEVVIIGGGNSSFEGILYLSNLCKKVYVINRSEKLRADEELVEEVKILKNVEIINNAVVTKLLEENGRLIGIETNNSKIIETNGVFVYIGLIPILNFIDIVETKNGYIVVDDKMETSVKGIYASGDIIKKKYYQLVTAASEGAIAANNIK